MNEKQYHEALLERLKDPKIAIAHLLKAEKELTITGLIMALNEVLEANRGLN